jgi:hypothetical protein
MYSVLKDALGLLPKQVLGKFVCPHCMAISASSQMTGVAMIVYAFVCKYRKVVWVKFQGHGRYWNSIGQKDITLHNRPVRMLPSQFNGSVSFTVALTDTVQPFT